MFFLLILKGWWWEFEYVRGTITGEYTPDFHILVNAVMRNDSSSYHQICSQFQSLLMPRFLEKYKTCGTSCMYVCVKQQQTKTVLLYFNIFRKANIQNIKMRIISFNPCDIFYRFIFFLFF